MEQNLENEFLACGWFGKVSSFNKLGWDHASDLGHCLSSWSSLPRGKNGVQGHLSGASSSIPTHHPKTLWVVCMGLGESPGAYVADPRFLNDPGRNTWGEIMVGGSQELSTDTHLGFPRAWHSGSQLTNTIHLNAGN